MTRTEQKDGCTPRMAPLYVRLRVTSFMSQIWTIPTRACSKFLGSSTPWKPLGHNTIWSSCLQSVTKLRAKAITILDDGNFASRRIMTVTGHKAESSLKTYSRHTSEEIKKSMSHWPGLSNPGQVLSCLSFSEMGHFLAYGNRWFPKIPNEPHIFFIFYFIIQ